MKLKKILSSLAQWLLMAGASLTMGLLSFSGILAICSNVAISFVGLVMSVVYEGQIYLDNILGSFKKLFKSNQLERQLAKACLLEYGFSEQEADRPQFFKDYERQLHLLHRFDHKRLDEASEARKHQIEKTLGDMEKWFAEQLFSDKEPQTDYQKKMRAWLERSRNDGTDSLRQSFQAKRKYRHILYQIIKALCVLSSVFMALGTTYLLVEAFTVIPLLAALPALAVPMLIVPMALIAGVAYGLLVYNAITDMIASETVQTWFKKIGEDLAPATEPLPLDSVTAEAGEQQDSGQNMTPKPPVNFKRWWAGVAKICVLSVMFLISLVLSICTAGTWWTVVKTTQPLFNWMGKIPAFFMLILNPLILSVSTWAFNVQNISETLEMAEPTIDSWVEEKPESHELEQEPVPDDKCDGLWKGKVSIELSDPDGEYQKRIVELKEIVFVRKGEGIVMWYCDNNAQCQQTSIHNPEIINLINLHTKIGSIKKQLNKEEKKIIEVLQGRKLRKSEVNIEFSDPDSDYQGKIIRNDQVVFVRHSHHIVMWYCDNKDNCERKKITNPQLIDLINRYTKTGYITNIANLNEIKRHLLVLGIKTETFLQWMNPFRLLSYLTFDPLRKLLFLGHLISIGATADQVPGVSPVVPAVLGAVSEGVEDIHYFKLWKDAPQAHKHDTQSLLNERIGSGDGHNHDNDLPTKFLIFLFSPIHFLAACWDFLFIQESNKFSSWNEFCTAFKKSWNKETGTPEEETVEFQGGDSSCEDQSCPVPHEFFSSRPNAWQTEQALFRIEKEKRNLVGTDDAQDIAGLVKLQNALVVRQDKTESPSLESTITDFCDKNLKNYNRNGFFKEKLIERTRDCFEQPPLFCSPSAAPRGA